MQAILYLLAAAAACAVLGWYMIVVPGESFRGGFAPLEAKEIALRAALKRHVETVASTEHNAVTPALYEQAAAYFEQGLARAGEPVRAMFSLETIGYYSDGPGGQRYPFPLGLFYPDRGDFLAFVANLASRALLHEAIAAFREQAHFPSEGVAAPAIIPGVHWSDQWSFWRHGVPALMLTDTAPYRYPHYHQENDTPDKVDYGRLARVVTGLERMFRALDERL